jgi:DnaK suppressor protein
MDTDKLEYYRNLIKHDIAALSVNQAKTLTELIVEAEPLPDMVDHSSSQSDRNFELRIRERERNLIVQMEGAILRIDNGTYGICDDCGEDISEKRLIARPVATLCISCKSKQEQTERRGLAGRSQGKAL